MSSLKLPLHGLDMENLYAIVLEGKILRRILGKRELIVLHLARIGSRF
jgi:hypothetical protein